MLTPDQDKEYAELKEEVREYLTYKKLHKRIDRYGRDLAMLLAIVFSVDLFLFRTGIAPYFLLAFFVTAIILLLGGSIVENLTERHSPTQTG
jgi:hypothetical protein